MNFTNFDEIIGKIEGISHAKVVYDDETLKELHILANNRRAPKQIVRDIETALLSVFDYRIDRRVISIAQIDMEGNSRINRVRYEGIVTHINDNNIDCTVKLKFNDESYSATETAVKTSVNRNKVVAKATIAVVENILGISSMFDIQDILIGTSGEVTLVSVVVNMIIEDKEETMVGSAIVKNEINEAIAKATLGAINRTIQRTIT